MLLEGGAEFQKANTPFGRTGGKSRLAEQIIRMFPDTKDYNTFVEPFVGAGNIFFRIEKDNQIREIINDKDPRVIRIFKALKKDPISFNDKIKRDFISKEYFESIKGSIKPEDDIILLKNSYRGDAKRYVDSHKGTATHNKVIQDYTKNFGERLADTIILNTDYKKVLQEYDSPKTLFYLDPPYESLTKNDYTNYVEPSGVFDSVKGLKGFVAISYNDSENIRSLFKNWYIKELETKYETVNDSPNKVVELFITNYKV